MNIYLVRHAEDTYNETKRINGLRNNSLTKKGQLQAETLAEKIKNTMTFDVIYTSPLERCMETATPIQKVLKTDLRVNDLLKERDLGLLNGLTVEEAATIYQGTSLHVGEKEYFISPENGESLPDTLVRAEKLLDDLRNKHEGETLCLVTHSGFAALFHAAYYQMSWQESMGAFHMKNADLVFFGEKGPEFL